MITTIRRQVVKRCPFKDEVDVGELVIIIPGDAPELHGLAEAIDGAAVDPVSHEEFTARVAVMVPPGSVVTTMWRTGPWEVEVTCEAVSR